MKKRIIAAFAAVVMLCAVPFAGCGGRSIGDTEQSLEVYVWDAGYGSQWMWDMLDAFAEQDWVQEKYPELEYDVTTNDLNNFAADRINSRTTTIDVFVGTGIGSLWESGNLLDIAESVYNQKVPGEDVYFKDKMPASILESVAAPTSTEEDMQYFATPGPSAMGGFVYNVTLFDELGLEVPNTTDELFELCEKVYNLDGKDEAYSHTHTFISTKVGYMTYMFPVWWAQYEGTEQYKNYYNGVYYDAASRRTYNNDVRTVKQQGRLESLEILEEIYRGHDGGYFDESSFANEFIQGQTQMFLRNGLIIACGDWFSTEMRELAADYAAQGYTDTMGFMNAPVISSIVDKCTTITDANAQKINLKDADALLSAVVEAVDNGDTVPAGDLVTAGVSQADFDTIRNARGVIYSIAGNEVTAITEYSNAKELACDFLLFMATDEANEVYSTSNYGTQRVFNWNLKEKAPELDSYLSENYGNTYRIQQDRAKMWEADNAYVLPWYGNYPLYVYGNLKALNGDYENFEATYIDAGKADVHAEDIWQNSSDYWTMNNNNRWNTALRNAGLV